jgi:hypothetical protein
VSFASGKELTLSPTQLKLLSLRTESLLEAIVPWKYKSLHIPICEGHPNIPPCSQKGFNFMNSTTAGYAVLIITYQTIQCPESWRKVDQSQVLPNV